MTLTKNIPWSRPFPRWRVPVGPLRAIGGREGQIGRIHLDRKKHIRFRDQIFFLYLSEKQREKSRRQLTKGGMIPRYGGNPGPTGGWGRGKAGLPAGGFLGGPWVWEFEGGTPAAPSITKTPPGPPSAAPSPDRVGARARPPPSRQLVTSENRKHKRGQSG